MNCTNLSSIQLPDNLATIAGGAIAAIQQQKMSFFRERIKPTFAFGHGLSLWGFGSVGNLYRFPKRSAQI